MKLFFITCITVIGFTLISQAQEVSKHAAGIRLSAPDGYGAELSYQHGLYGRSRIEADLGILSNSNYNAVKLTGLYQRVYEIFDNFNWYAGVGGGLGIASNDDRFQPNGNRIDGENITYVYLAGNGGVEYHFDFPLMVSADFRPEIGFDDDLDRNVFFSLGVSARYKF